MEILKGLLYVNNVDVYEEYGVFLTEDASGKHDNYSALLTSPRTKPYVAVNFREDNGEKLPTVLPDPAFEARDVTLYFAIIADVASSFKARYFAFINFLKSGWLEMRLTELNRNYKMYYLECPGHEQITDFEGQVAARFKVKFREPVPNFS